MEEMKVPIESVDPATGLITYSDTPEKLKEGEDIVKHQLESFIQLGAGKEVVNNAIKQNNEISAIIKEALNEGSHYGLIPGIKTKVLFQAGADVLARTYGIEVKLEKTDYEVNFDNHYVDYTFTATALYEGKVLLTDSASANSLEQKFRSSFQDHNEKTGEWTNKPKKSVFDIKNTILQMASKRAYVRVIRKVLGITGEFTQDISTNAGKASLGVYSMLYSYMPNYSKEELEKNNLKNTITDKKTMAKQTILYPILEKLGLSRKLNSWTDKDIANIEKEIENWGK